MEHRHRYNQQVLVIENKQKKEEEKKRKEKKRGNFGLFKSRVCQFHPQTSRAERITGHHRDFRGETGVAKDLDPDPIISVDGTVCPE